MLSLLTTSCQKSQETISREQESEKILSRTELVQEFFDETPCGNIIGESGWEPEDCIPKTHIGEYKCDLYPECVFKVTVNYLYCPESPSNGITQVFINEPEILTDCPEFLEVSAKCRWGDCKALYAELYACLIKSIEFSIWNEASFPLEEGSCFTANDIFSLTWLNSSCSAFRYLYTLDGGMALKKIYCNETGCCYRESYLCLTSDGELEYNVDYYEQDAISGCPSEIQDPGAVYGYTECTYECPSE